MTEALAAASAAHRMAVAAASATATAAGGAEEPERAERRERAARVALSAGWVPRAGGPADVPPAEEAPPQRVVAQPAAPPPQPAAPPRATAPVRATDEERALLRAALAEREAAQRGGSSAARVPAATPLPRALAVQPLHVANADAAEGDNDPCVQRAVAAAVAAAVARVQAAKQIMHADGRLGAPPVGGRVRR